MEHNYIEAEKESEIKKLVIYQKDNNLDHRDNLDDIPTGPAVYMICGRVNGRAANPRYVGETNNLQKAIKKHFDKSVKESDSCFKEFILSIKIKELVYQLLPGSKKEDRLLKKTEWSDKYQPKCNEELNEIH